MKDTAPIGQGIIAVAALFGVVGAGVAFVLYGYGLIGSVFIGGIVAFIVAILLWLGWRKPNAPYSGPPEIETPDIAGGAAASGSASTATPSAASQSSAAAASTAASSSSAASAETSTPAAAASAGAAVKPSAKLAGEDALAEKKGDWKYEGGDAAKPAAATPAPDASATPDYDGDGVHEGTDEGTRPAALDGPRDGKADNLKEIKGIGPKLEKLCNRLGFYHFDQIAAWTSDEVAWVDANLEGFKGRVSRDTWVEQAKILAAGGETEFSKKVDKGGVY